MSERKTKLGTKPKSNRGSVCLSMRWALSPRPSEDENFQLSDTVACGTESWLFNKKYEDKLSYQKFTFSGRNCEQIGKTELRQGIGVKSG